MASVMPSSSTAAANSDLARRSPIYSQDPSPSSSKIHHGSSIMDDLIRNMYESSESNKSVDGVWKEIAGRKIDGGEITLEEYLSKEEIMVPAGFEVDPAAVLAAEGQDPAAAPPLGFGNGVEGARRARGRKRQVLDPVDRAALQRQKRMIKNRESAARSRERKQAYTGELENLVTRLEEENASLLKEQVELQRQRIKLIMENLIPVTEKKKPPRSLRRTQTVQW